MKIRDLFRAGNPVFSFEFFPPQTDEGVSKLERTIGELRDLTPSFVSVTYGAGGSTRERTVELVGRIQREIGILAMAHLTCVGHARDEIAAILDRLVAAGVENVLPLRGDPRAGQGGFSPHPQGFAHASELVTFIRERHAERLCLGGACYPESHVEAPDWATDLAHLGTKVRAGVDFLITQIFFDNRRYFEFVARARAAGITVPILPGIMPITNVAQIERFTKICGATVPPALRAEFDRCRDNPAATIQLGVAHATAQCVGLLGGGAPGIHFYTLNQSPSTRVILTALRAARLA